MNLMLLLLTSGPDTNLVALENRWFFVYIHLNLSLCYVYLKYLIATSMQNNLKNHNNNIGVEKKYIYTYDIN